MCSPQQYKDCASPALGKAHLFSLPVPIHSDIDHNPLGQVLLFLALRPADAMLRKDTCVCPNPCATTRYAKELSMVRIPSRASARYLARKYNRSETYIT